MMIKPQLLSESRGQWRCRTALWWTGRPTEPLKLFGSNVQNENMSGDLQKWSPFIK